MRSSPSFDLGSFKRFSASPQAANALVDSRSRVEPAMYRRLRSPRRCVQHPECTSNGSRARLQLHLAHARVESRIVVANSIGSLAESKVTGGARLRGFDRSFALHGMTGRQQRLIEGNSDSDEAGTDRQERFELCNAFLVATQLRRNCSVAMPPLPISGIRCRPSPVEDDGFLAKFGRVQGHSEAAAVLADARLLAVAMSSRAPWAIVPRLGSGSRGTAFAFDIALTCPERCNSAMAEAMSVAMLERSAAKRRQIRSRFRANPSTRPGRLWNEAGWAGLTAVPRGLPRRTLRPHMRAT